MNWFGNAPGLPNETPLEEIAPGSHLCSICEHEHEWIGSAVQFLAQGLERGEQCVYVGEEGTRSAIAAGLVDRGIDAELMMATGALVLAPPEEAGLKGDHTDVYRMFTFWKKVSEPVVRGQFRALRGADQTTWLRTDVMTAQQLRAYEERLTQLAEETGSIFLCHCDVRHRPASFVLDGVCTHPFVLHRGELCRNVFCVPSGESSGSSLESRVLDTLLQGLRLHEQTRRELVGTQAELARVARIITLGELTASVAHEVAQPVAGMIADGGAALRWLASTPPQVEEARLSLARIVAGGRRAESVIQRIRSLVKKAESHKELLSVNDAITEVVALTRDRVQQAGIVLRTDLAPSLPYTWAHRVQIQQVVLNLLLNALEAINARPGGKREICIRTQHDARYVKVSVTDSGIGLGTDQVQYVLKAFYTTKPHGMGIGLSISSRIIEGHDGQLWAERNQDDVGATFHFTLPLPPS